MISNKTFAHGTKKGIKLIIELSKYIIPSVFVIKILEHSGLLERVSGFMAPYMSYIGLPGEGALVLLFGQVSMYGAIGAMIPLGLTAKQITICCSMISIIGLKNGFVIPLIRTAIHFASVRFRFLALLFGI